MSNQRNCRPIDILLVEDNPGDVRLTREAFDEAQITNELHVVTDGEEALAFLYRRDEFEDAPVPNLVLLDLNLPKMDGIEVLKTIKQDPDLKRIPVVILTGSKARDDIQKGYQQHGNAYLTKPVDPEEFVDLVQSFEDFWFTLVELPPSHNVS